MVIADAYKDGELTLPNWGDEWGLNEWAAVPAVVGIILSLFRIQLKSVHIRKLGDDN